ncbi:hypothetical protein MEO41_27435, partial [Dolichospermum sp. ST_sed4]|nr:hypothetical protein [Dolichospermum sp. ST_sed4]
MRKKLILFGIMFLALGLIITGCGGGTDSSDMAVTSPDGQTGTLSVAIDWPVQEKTTLGHCEEQGDEAISSDSSKIIPAGTARITLTITGDGLSSPVTDQFTNTSGSITKQYSLPIGNKIVTLNAYDAPTGGNLLAQRIQNVTILFGQTATLTATLGSSISDSGFTPQTITIPKGSSLMWLNNGTT